MTATSPHAEPIEDVRLPTTHLFEIANDLDEVHDDLDTVERALRWEGLGSGSGSGSIASTTLRVNRRVGAVRKKIETLRAVLVPLNHAGPRAREALEALYMAAAILGEEDGHPPVPAQTAFAAGVAVQVAIQSLGGDGPNGLSPERVRAYIASCPQDPPDVLISHVAKTPKKARAARRRSGTSKRSTGGGNHHRSTKAAK